MTVTKFYNKLWYYDAVIDEVLNSHDNRNAFPGEGYENTSLFVVRREVWTAYATPTRSIVILSKKWRSSSHSYTKPFFYPFVLVSTLEGDEYRGLRGKKILREAREVAEHALKYPESENNYWIRNGRRPLVP